MVATPRGARLCNHAVWLSVALGSENQEREVFLYGFAHILLGKDPISLTMWIWLRRSQNSKY